MANTPEARAVKIAAHVMQEAGVCRYDDISKCHRIFVDEQVCEACLARWLLSRAKRELRKEGKPCTSSS